jgi:hypothetical protein
MLALVTTGWAEDTEPDNFAVIVNFDNTFMRFSQEGGVADGIGSKADFDYEYAPRVDLGVIFHEDLGTRVRGWYFDADTESSLNNCIEVETYYLDFELFQRVPLNERNELEYSLGIRHLDFEQIQESAPGVDNKGEFSGWGGTVSLLGRREVWMGSLYARGRFSILVGDHDATIGATKFSANDNNVYMTEIGLGYEFAIPIEDIIVLNCNIGLEWQNWSNLALADTNFGGVGNDDVLEDVSFYGLVLGVGAEF